MNYIHSVPLPFWPTGLLISDNPLLFYVKNVIIVIQLLFLPFFFLHLPAR